MAEKNSSEFTVEELELALEQKRREEMEQKLQAKKKVVKQKKKREKVLDNSSVMDYLIITCILSILIYVGVALFFYYGQGTPPTEDLTRLFFAFFGGELLAMAGITISKHKAEAREDELH